MGDLAIRVENLGKLYRIGQRRRHTTIGEVLTGAICNPFRSAHAHLSGPRVSQSPLESDDTIWALRGVSFEVKHGEIIGIIGRNGSGKSTLLKILSRITAPSEGYAELHGRVGSLLEVGTGFHSELTGRENIYLSGVILGMKKAEIKRQLDEIIAFAEIEKFLDTAVKHYSSGMYMRLAFAVAAHLYPEILLVDEVLAVGDAAFQRKCLGKLGEVAKAGRTVLFVSHNMGAIVRLCQRALLLRAGTIVAMDKSETVVADYLSPSSRETLDVSLDAGSSPNSPLVLTRCWVTDNSGDPVAVAHVTNEFRIMLKILARKEVLDVDISVRVSNMFGYPLFTSNLSDATNGLARIRPGEHTFTVAIPGCFLAPDKYSLHIGIHRPNVEILDVHDDILTFRVEESGSKMWPYHGKGYGNILVHFPWHQG